jgi:hypothetical protein
LRFRRWEFDSSRSQILNYSGVAQWLEYAAENRVAVVQFHFSASLVCVLIGLHNKCYFYVCSTTVVKMGALTSKVYSFSARPWELTNSIVPNFMDIGGTFIRLDFRGNQIMRVLPQSSYSSDYTDAIISDRLRFSYDSQTNNRIVDVLCISRDGKFSKSNEFVSYWYQIFDWPNTLINLEYWFSEIVFASDSILGISQTIKFCQLINSFNGFSLPFQINTDFREYFIVKDSISNFLTYDLVLCVSHNPFDILQNYSALLFKSFIQNKLFSIGFSGVKSLEVIPCNLSLDCKIIERISCGQHKFCALVANSKSMVVFYDGKLSFEIFVALEFMVNFIKTNFVAILELVPINFPSNSVNLSEFGQCQTYIFNDFSSNSEIDYFYGYGTDDFYCDPDLLDFSIYSGSYNDRSANKAKFCLPVTNFLEEFSLYYNEFGKLNQFNAPLRVTNSNLRSGTQISIMFVHTYLDRCFQSILFNEFICYRFFNFSMKWALVPSKLFNYSFKSMNISANMVALCGFFESYYSNPWFSGTITRMSGNMILAAQRFNYTIELLWSFFLY